MPIPITVVLCTRNPRLDFLTRVFAALRQQTLPLSEWDLVVIDNNSTPSLGGRVDVSWHPRARLVAEDRPGLTFARMRGSREATGELVIFVDDDNLLAPDYLAVAQRLAVSTPFLGVWSARITGEFELPPASWMTPYLPFLALTEFSTDAWSNHPQGRTLPVGAGMVVRREVMAAYCEALARDSSRAGLDRNGTSLLAGGDTDIGRTACGIGLGCGWMKDLRVTHLIPASRLEPAYLARLAEDVTASHQFLELEYAEVPLRRYARAKLFAKGCIGRIAGPKTKRGFEGAIARGVLRGAALVRASRGTG